VIIRESTHDLSKFGRIFKRTDEGLTCYGMVVATAGTPNALDEPRGLPLRLSHHYMLIGARGGTEFSRVEH
jgi:hypothetical protein